jgi:hypothetical protein
MSEITTEKPQVTKKRKLNKDDQITIMNYTAGTAFYLSPRTQQEWKLVGFGAIDQIPYDELMTMKSSQPKLLKEPWIIVMDDDAIEQLSLKDVYKKILQPEEIDKFYSKMSHSQMEKFLDNATESMKELLLNLTLEKIRNKEFGDLFKIKLIESKLGKSLLTS